MNLAQARSELLSKLDYQINKLRERPAGWPSWITFTTASGTYKLLNDMERLTQFRHRVAVSPGWTGKLKGPESEIYAEYRRAGVRGTPIGSGFREAVTETANTEREIRGELTTAINAQQKLRQDVEKLQAKQKEALLNCAYARGESAVFEAFRQDQRGKAYLDELKVSK